VSAFSVIESYLYLPSVPSWHETGTVFTFYHVSKGMYREVSFFMNKVLDLHNVFICLAYERHSKYLLSLNDITSLLNLETQSNVVQFADSFYSEKEALT